MRAEIMLLQDGAWDLRTACMQRDVRASDQIQSKTRQNKWKYMLSILSNVYQYIFDMQPMCSLLGAHGYVPQHHATHGMAHAPHCIMCQTS